MADEKKNESPADPVMGGIDALKHVVGAYRFTGRKAREEDEKYQKFYREHLKPLEREVEIWEQVRGGLETLSKAQDAEYAHNAIGEIITTAHESKDREAAKISTTLETYLSNGLPFREKEGRTYIDNIRLSEELAKPISNASEAINHYNAQIEKTIKEHGVSRLPYYAWKAADTAKKVGVTALVGLAVWKKLKPW